MQVKITMIVVVAMGMGDGRLPMPVPHLGILYLTVSRTLILLYKSSNAISRPSFFPHTSAFSAFEVSYKNAPYTVNPLLLYSYALGAFFFSRVD